MKRVIYAAAAAALFGGTLFGFGCSSSPMPKASADQATLAFGNDRRAERVQQ